MLLPLLSLLLSTTYSVANPLPGGCAGGHANGEKVYRGIFFYTCENGNLIKKGCINKITRGDLAIGESYVENGYELTCFVRPDGFLGFKQTGCVIDGQRYQAGETWANDKFWYTCDRSGDYIIQKVSGCVKDNRRVEINNRARSSRILYECQTKADGATAMCAIGCVQNNLDYLIGENWSDGRLNYACTTEGGFCHTAVTSCIGQGGREYRANEQFLGNNGISIYRCEISSDGVQGRAVPYGCRGLDGRDYQVGQTWVEGSNTMQCRQADGGGDPFKDIVG